MRRLLSKLTLSLVLRGFAIVVLATLPFIAPLIGLSININRDEPATPWLPQFLAFAICQAIVVLLATLLRGKVDPVAFSISIVVIVFFATASFFYVIEVSNERRLTNRHISDIVYGAKIDAALDYRERVRLERLGRVLLTPDLRPDSVTNRMLGLPQNDRREAFIEAVKSIAPASTLQERDLVTRTSGWSTLNVMHFGGAVLIGVSTLATIFLAWRSF